MKNRIYIHLGSRSVGRLGNQFRKLSFMQAVCVEHPEIGFIDFSTVPFTDGLACFKRVAVVGNVDPAQLPWHVRGARFLIDRLPSRALAIKVCAAYHRCLRFSLAKCDSGRFLCGGGEEDYHYEASAFLENTFSSSTSVVYYAEYLVYAPEWLRRHAAVCREIFEFDAAIEQRASDFIAKIRSTVEIVVGIPIRLTDYRTYRGGSLCVEPSRVGEYMQAVVERHAGKSVAFVVTCDERLPPDAFDGFNVILSTGTVGGSGGVLDAIAQLSRCDYLVGALSTLAMSIAMKGGIDLFMADKSSPVELAFLDPVSLFESDAFTNFA
jgi:hypothetical protein